MESQWSGRVRYVGPVLAMAACGTGFSTVLSQHQTGRLLLEHSALSAIIKLFTAGSAGSVASLSSFLSFRDYNPSHPTPRQALLGSRQIYWEWQGRNKVRFCLGVCSQYNIMLVCSVTLESEGYSGNQWVVITVKLVVVVVVVHIIIFLFVHDRNNSEAPRVI